MIFYKPSQIYRLHVLIISNINFAFYIEQGNIYISFVYFKFADHIKVLILLISKKEFSIDDVNPCHVLLSLYTPLLFWLLILT